MPNEAYTTASPFELYGNRSRANSSHSRGGGGGRMWRALKTQLEIQGSKEEKKNGHNRNPHIPNITPHVHQSRSSGMREMADVHARECFCEDVLPVDGGERPFGPGFGPVRLGLACHVYVCGKHKTERRIPCQSVLHDCEQPLHE